MKRGYENGRERLKRRERLKKRRGTQIIKERG